MTARLQGSIEKMRQRMQDLQGIRTQREPRPDQQLSTSNPDARSTLALAVKEEYFFQIKRIYTVHGESIMKWSSKQIAAAVSLAAALGCNMAVAAEIQSKTQKVEGSANLQTITLSGDTLFKFGDDQLSPKGKKALDELIKKGSLSPMTRYMIEGHTDNIGDKGENGKLSVRRAESVRKYLLSKDANLKLESGGKGEAVPVVQCSDKLPKEKLVACLAPNRRVTIDPIY